MMMQKAMPKPRKVARGKKKLDALKTALDPTLRTHIRAQMATATPPLGPDLGQRGVNVANFCKDFNNLTTGIKLGAEMPVTVRVKPDRTYDIDIETPTTVWLLKRAAGIRRQKQSENETVGILSVKHIYEIAKIKAQDKALIGVPLKDICELVIQRADSIGIKVQREDLDPAKYRAFLEQRRETVKQQLEEIAKKEEAKLLRT